MYVFAEDELERVEACSACGGALGAPELEGARDTTFFNVGGSWSFYRCTQCASLQLSPRPTPAAIHHAYATYYTHQGETPVTARDRLLAAWTRWAPRQRTLLRAAAALTLKPVLLATDLRGLDDVSTPLRVLDIGCGNGGFLARAKARGHTCLGLDNDDGAVSSTRALGIACEQGTIADLPTSLEGSFDLLTASHVIEHVHEPALFLADCARLLRPGGTLWLETPNACAWGERLFGEDWRGLEIPRHLQLFSPRALEQLVGAAGFVAQRQHWTGLVSPFVHAQSRKSRRARELGAAASTAESPLSALPKLGLAVSLDLLRAVFAPAAQEFMTMTARKPG